MHGHTLEGVFDLESHADLVYREHLERILKRTHPLQPPQSLRNQVEVDKEPDQSHLVQARQRAQ